MTNIVTKKSVLWNGTYLLICTFVLAFFYSHAFHAFDMLMPQISLTWDCFILCLPSIPIHPTIEGAPRFHSPALVVFEFFLSIRNSWLTEPLYLLSPRPNCQLCPKTMTVACRLCLPSLPPVTCRHRLPSLPPVACRHRLPLLLTPLPAVAPPCCLPPSPAAVADAVVDAIRLF